MITPVLKSLLIPVRSPQRPKGSKNIAVARRKEVTTQLSVTAFSWKLFSIAGRAIFTEEMRKVPINEVMATMASIEICFLVQSILKNLVCLLFNGLPRQASLLVSRHCAFNYKESKLNYLNLELKLIIHSVFSAGTKWYHLKKYKNLSFFVKKKNP